MSTYTATIRWSAKPGEDFAKGQYSRAHEWAFDGGALVPASASPHIVPAPWSDAARGRSGRSVHRLVVVVPHAVLPRLRQARRVGGRRLC